MLDNLKEIRNLFKKDASPHKMRNAFGGLVTQSEGGLEYTCLNSGPCHGFFSANSLFYREIKSNSIEYLLSSVQAFQVNKEIGKSFIKWLVDQSPWKEVFITKDVEDILEFGYVVDAKFPSNLIISALIATRFVTESHTPTICERVKVHEEIKSLGFGGEVAYIFSHLFNSERTNQKSLYPIIHAPLSSNHSVFDFSCAEEDYYRNFLTASPKNLSSKTFKEEGGYSTNVCSVWNNYYNSAGHFGEWLSLVKPINAAEAANLNIFKKNTVKNYLISNREEFKSVIDQALERINNAK